MLEILKALRNKSKLDPIANKRAYQTYSIMIFIMIVWGCFMVYASVFVFTGGILTRLVIFFLGMCMLVAGIALFPRKGD